MGINKWVIAKPPTIKQQVAMRDGICKLDSPMIAWPEVQPPAYRVPNPTKKPPRIKNMKPFAVNNVSSENKSAGIRPEKS